MPIKKGTHYYADPKELQEAFQEFQQAFPIVSNETVNSFDKITNNLLAHFQTHEMPKDHKSAEYHQLSPVQTLLATEPEILDVSTPGCREFEELFQAMYREEYPKQYITSLYVGDRLATMNAKRIPKTTGNIFIYDTTSLHQARSVESSYRDGFDHEQQHMIDMQNAGLGSPEEFEARKKALQLAAMFKGNACKLFEQQNYAASRVWLLGNQKETLSQRTSKQTYDKFQNLANQQYQLLGFETAQNCAVMDAIFTELKKPTFDFRNIESHLTSYQKDVYAAGLEKDRAASIQKSANMNSNARAVSEVLTDYNLGPSLALTLHDMDVKDFFGVHKDSREMQQIKQSTKALQQTLRDLNTKLLDDPSYVLQVENDLQKALKDARSYLSAKDKDGKKREDRTKMGQTRYKAVQGLANRLQRTTDALQWKKTEASLQNECQKYEDQNYRELMQDQLRSKQTLFELAQKPYWMESDRKLVNKEISALVARQKLSVAYAQNDQASTALWDHYTDDHQIADKISVAIQDDAVIRNATDNMSPDTLMRFLSGKGERALNLEHMNQLVVQRTAAKKAEAKPDLQKNANQRKHTPSVMG